MTNPRMVLRPFVTAWVGVLLVATPAAAAESWLDPDAADAATAAAEPERVTPSRRGVRRERPLAGGLTLGVASEVWSPSTLGTGPQFEVGVALGRRLALVFGESARFSFDPSAALQMMAFDLQTGLALGAPFQIRTGFGVVLLVGAERLSSSTTIEAIMTWSAIGSLGVRASVEVGPLDLWMGADAMARTSTIEIGGSDPVRVPSFTGLLSAGCFLPAFAMGPTSR